MMILGIPAINQHEYTRQTIDSLVTTVRSPQDITIVIVDNNSSKPYRSEDYDTPFKVEVLRNERNEGYYYPIKQLQEKYPEAEYVGVVHNDVIFYEAGWNERMVQAFSDPLLGLIGLCGSNEVDVNGGRGMGTMCCFNGAKGQAPTAGYCDSGLTPALILDSLFMLFRSSVIPKLHITDKIVPCHFMDRVLPLKVIDNGYRVGVMGVEIDHLGGITEVAEPQYYTEAISYCERNGIEHNGNPNLAIYKLAESEYLNEYREVRKLIPCRIDKQWTIFR